MKLSILAFLSVVSVTANTLVHQARGSKTIHDIVLDERRFVVYNSRRLTGECLSVCEDSNVIQAPTLGSTPSLTENLATASASAETLPTNLDYQDDLGVVEQTQTAPLPTDSPTLVVDNVAGPTLEPTASLPQASASQAGGSKKGSKSDKSTSKGGSKSTSEKISKSKGGTAKSTSTSKGGSKSTSEKISKSKGGTAKSTSTSKGGSKSTSEKISKSKGGTAKSTSTTGGKSASEKTSKSSSGKATTKSTDGKSGSEKTSKSKGGSTKSSGKGKKTGSPTMNPTSTPKKTSTGCTKRGSIDNGVSDKNCEKCTGKYKWWPCNSKKNPLCEGTECVLH